MIRKGQRLLWLAGLAASLSLGGGALAQTSEKSGFSLKGLFGSKTTAPEAKITPGVEEAQRATEIMVELAWLGDPGTFAYFLEARVTGQSLEVRGYVPSRAVRAQALNLAKLHCPLPVVDSLKEHSALTVQTFRRSPDQLQKAVQTALREAFPGQPLNVQCTPEGNVRVSGSVRSLEQKLAVSKSLRRLHGCTSVTNLTQVSATEVVQQPAPAKSVPTTQLPPNERPSEQPGQANPEQKRGIFGMFAKNPPAPTAQAKDKTPEAPKAKVTDQQPANIQPVSTKTPAQTKPGDPYESRGMVVMTPEESRTAQAPQTPTANTLKTTAAPAASMSAAQLKKRIEVAVPAARNVQVIFTSKTEVRVECTARSGDDSGALAGQILSLREMEPYRVDLHISLPTPEMK